MSDSVARSESYNNGEVGGTPTPPRPSAWLKSSLPLERVICTGSRFQPVDTAETMFRLNQMSSSSNVHKKHAFDGHATPWYIFVLFLTHIYAISTPYQHGGNTEALVSRADVTGCSSDEVEIINATMTLIEAACIQCVGSLYGTNTDEFQQERFLFNFGTNGQLYKDQARSVFHTISGQAHYTRLPHETPTGYPHLRLGCRDQEWRCGRTVAGYISQRNNDIVLVRPLLYR